MYVCMHACLYARHQHTDDSNYSNDKQHQQKQTTTALIILL
jgi:hypothetical protein